MDTDLLDKVQRQLRELDANVAKLRQALRHWQSLELDYEGLKDEFLALDEDADKAKCLQAAQSFEPSKVGETEIQDLIQPTQGKVRRPSQIVDLLSKRVDYVTRNIGTLRDQIAEVEKKRNSLLLLDAPEAEDSAGLPVTEIIEELDDDGNIISTSLQPQSDSASKVLDVLDQAQVQLKDDAHKKTPSSRHLPKNDSAQGDSTVDSDDESVASEIVSAGAHEAALHQPTNPDDTEEEARLRQEMLQYGLDEVGTIVAELELAEGESGEFDEDASMDDASNSDYDDDDDEAFDEDESEDEDGQSRSVRHSEKYRQKMEKLQAELGLQMQNAGPHPDLPAEINDQIQHPSSAELKDYLERLPPGLRKQVDRSRPDPKEAARKAAIARAEASKNAQAPESSTAPLKATKKSKKQVAFAPELDIAPTSQEKAKPTTTAETVVERTPSSISASTKAPVPAHQPAKVSRFKASRSAPPETQSTPSLFPPPMESSASVTKPIPTGPAGKIVSDVLVERPENSLSADAPAPPDPHDFDTDLQQRQIALEHHRLRNRRIHEQGGYIKGGELENYGEEYAAPEFTDPKTGQPKKVSRFKAARMRP